MQITETNSTGLKREFKVVVPADKVQDQVETRLKELGERIKMPGFRPGKVPMQLLKQHKTEVVRIRAERDESLARRGKKTPSHDRERLASDADMRRALVKSLRAFGVRVTKEALQSQSGGGTPSPQASPAGEGEE